MTLHIALISDRSGRYAHVWSDLCTWNQFVDQLEDIGCEVIENQTIEWYGCTRDEIAEDCLSVHRLLNNSDFIPHD